MSFKDINLLTGMIVAGVLQYLIVGKQGFRAAAVVLLSAFLLAFYIIDPILNIIGQFTALGLTIKTTAGSPFYTMMMVGSPLISAEVISFIVLVLPNQIRKKALKILGAKNDIRK